jgi:hypothetical protein
MRQNTLTAKGAPETRREIEIMSEAWIEDVRVYRQQLPLSGNNKID